MFAYKLDIENGNFVFSDDRLHKKFTSARQDIDFLWNIAIRAIIFATNFLYCCCFQFYGNVICVAYLFKQNRCDSFSYILRSILCLILIYYQSVFGLTLMKIKQQTNTPFILELLYIYPPTFVLTSYIEPFGNIKMTCE